MSRAWTKRILVGCLLTGPFACTVSVNDGPLDEVGGTSGSSGSSASGTSGSSGSSGAGGTAGAGAQGGSAGMSMVENGGGGGTTEVPAVCTPEAGDAQDPCLSCIKQECCTEWRACNDSSCQQERRDMQDCVSMLDAPDQESYGDCATMSSVAMDGFLQENTNAVFECVNTVAGDAGETTRCGNACFGMDVYL